MRWRPGIRFRLTLLAVLLTLFGVGLAGTGLVALLEDNLESSATESAAARAAAVADVVTSIGLSEAARTVVASPRDGQVVQLIGPDHRVFSSSDPSLANRPIADLDPEPGRTATGETTGLVGVAGEWSIAARGVSARNASYVVQVAVPIGTGYQVIRTIVRYLLIGTPVLMLVVGLAVWLLVGVSLRPVERIRRQVQQIDAGHLDERVDVPAARDEIAALATTMNAMLDRLEDSDAAQRAFVSDASHELRSPLATVMTATELAVSAHEPRRTHLLETARRELLRLRDLVDNLMALARSDAAARPDRLGPVDLDELLAAERARLRTTGSLELGGTVEPVQVRGETGGLQRAVRNLVDNAQRHATTSVRLGLRRDGDDAVVTVDNDGPPIAAADRQRIFERFVRLDESRSRDEGGSGLGLAIVASVAQAHGGRVAVVDAEPGWCRFELRLPAGSDQSASSR